VVTIKSERELNFMREAGKIVAESLALIEENIRPGISTGELDDIIQKYMKKVGARPSFLGYNGFPAAICTSINDELVHGIPSYSRILEDGDIISVDIGAEYKGYHGDSAKTFAVGKISETATNLMRVTEESLIKGIAAAVPGGRLTDISFAIQTHIESNGMSVVKDYTGHGIGQQMHEDPQILNYGPPGRGIKLRPGMALAIEPMVIVGGYQVKELDDGWTVVSADGSLCAHFEHTIGIYEHGTEILTKK
jgi:methionyl aminopeptidase